MFLTKWLKKWVNQVKFKFTQRKFKEVSDTHFGRQYLEALAALLEPAMFKDLRINDVRLIQTLGAKSITDLVKMLAEINAMLRNGKMVPNDWFTTIAHTERFDVWINRDGDNCYIELELQVRQFKRLLLEFTELMAPSDLAETGLHEHNRRVLTRPACVVRQITFRLLENIHL